ncbi:hypothetical protein [Promicromonospora sukumoe]|uniref:Uncharacterized protein n=1 Tax=Promicromonospora sukumoe TaxID=88382 RepID=A0A7W3JCN2_9MICO|nr:hypothetical protein [Promicromonospora sukumoe]MBA8810349.1 hypothetical protein [Promicromonospora sukumoe]
MAGEHHHDLRADAARPVVGRDPKVRFYPVITPGISVIPGAMTG